MRGHPSLLLVYVGLANCLDTLPHREQKQGPESPSLPQAFSPSEPLGPGVADPWEPGTGVYRGEVLLGGGPRVLEDNTLTERFWEGYKYNGKGGRGRVDVAGLAVGLTSGILLIVLTGLGAFWYLQYRRRRHLRAQESCLPETGLIIPLSPPTPQSPPLPPGLPTYEQALAASGVHDAPPPPYSSLRRPH